MSEITCKPGDGFILKVLPVKADGTQARVENPTWSQTGSGGVMTVDASDPKVAYFNADATVVGTLSSVVTFTCDADLDETEVRELTATAVFIVKEEEAESLSIDVTQV